MGMVSIKTVANELGIHKDYALRLVKKWATELGITVHHGKRNALSLSREDADRLISNYEPRASLAVPVNDVVRLNGFGYFYIIQLHPEDLPTRLKIGYTDNLDVRQSDQRADAKAFEILAMQTNLGGSRQVEYHARGLSADWRRWVRSVRWRCPRFH